MKIVIDGETVEIPSGGGGEPSNGEVYSTEETRIGTWIDGKPLYRKVYQVTCPPAGGYAIVIPATSIPNIVLRDIRGYLHSNSNTAGGVVNFAYSRAYIATWNYGGSIYMETNNNDYANSPAEIILEYTKTTDQATASTSSKTTGLKNTTDFALDLSAQSAPSAPVTVSIIPEEEE